MIDAKPISDEELARLDQLHAQSEASFRDDDKDLHEQVADFQASWDALDEAYPALRARLGQAEKRLKLAEAVVESAKRRLPLSIDHDHASDCLCIDCELIKTVAAYRAATETKSDL